MGAGGRRVAPGFLSSSVNTNARSQGKSVHRPWWLQGIGCRQAQARELRNTKLSFVTLAHQGSENGWAEQRSEKMPRWRLVCGRQQFQEESLVVARSRLGLGTVGTPLAILMDK